MTPSFKDSPLLLSRILAVFAICALALLLKPYPTTVFMALCVSILTMPYFTNLQVRYGAYRSMLIYAFAIILVIFIPIGLLAILLIPQVINGLRLLEKWRATDWKIPDDIEAQLMAFYDWLLEIPQLGTWINEISADLDTLIHNLVGTLVSGSVGFARELLNFAWYSFLFLVLTVLFLAYAQAIKSFTDKILNLGEGIFERFIITTRTALRSVVMGIFFVAFLQGLVCTMGYILFGVPEPLFWGLLSCLVAPIPFVGTALVWFPLSLFLWFNISSTMSIALIAWGTFAVAAVDNFARPYFLSTGIKAPFFVLLLSLLCGLAVFGPVGLIAGPLLISFALQCASECSLLLDIEIPEMHEEGRKNDQAIKLRVLSRLKGRVHNTQVNNTQENTVTKNT